MKNILIKLLMTIVNKIFIEKKKFANKLIRLIKIIPKSPYSEKLLFRLDALSLKKLKNNLPYTIRVNETIVQLINIFIIY